MHALLLHFEVVFAIHMSEIQVTGDRPSIV